MWILSLTEIDMLESQEIMQANNLYQLISLHIKVREPLAISLSAVFTATPSRAYRLHPSKSTDLT